MYQPFNIRSAAATVVTQLAKLPITGPDDGLVLNTSGLTVPMTGTIPDRLFDWLTGLRLLRNLPLSYLVPDEALLPPESIRFFHVDLTWVDRVIDGVFSAANTGTVDCTYSYATLQAMRFALDKELQIRAQQQVADSTWDPDSDGMTGMLIRSDLVRRWPDLIVRAHAGLDESSTAVPVLRAEPISKDVHISIFAGAPALVQIREPHVGVRFGLETDDQKTYHVKARDDDGKFIETKPPKPPTLPIPVGLKSPESARVVQLSTVITPMSITDNEHAPRRMAILLMREPYVQQFAANIDEKTGSQDPPATLLIAGREIDLTDLHARHAEAKRLGRL